MNYFIRYLVVLYVNERYGAYVCDLIKDVTKTDSVRVKKNTSSGPSDLNLRLVFWADSDAGNCIDRSLRSAGIEFKDDMGVDALC